MEDGCLAASLVPEFGVVYHSLVVARSPAVFLPEPVTQLAGVQRTSLADQAYAVVRDAIQVGELKPGMRLVERRLAEQLGISRTPLREAMIRLAQDGVLCVPPSGGMVVALVDKADAIEWYAIRKGLEGYAARLATERADARLLSDLRSIALQQHDFLDPLDLRALDRLNNEFHEALYASTGMIRLAELIASYRSRALHYFVYGVYTPDEARRGVDDHERIVDFMSRGDGDLVEKLLREHIAQGERIVLERRVSRHRTSR